METVFLIAICHQWGDKWQSKTLFLLIFDLRFLDSIGIFDCPLPGVFINYFNHFVIFTFSKLFTTIQNLMFNRNEPWHVISNNVASWQV